MRERQRDGAMARLRTPLPQELESYENMIRMCDDDGEGEADNDGNAPEKVTLTHAETCASLRMAYAICYYGAQGTTMMGRNVTPLDTRHRTRKESYFAMRHLIVGLSRATHGCYVHIPTCVQEVP